MQTLKEMPTEKLCSELDAAIARLHAERVRLRELLQRLVNNIESGESTEQCIGECKRTLALITA
jgi:hypothetical protein